MDFGRLGLRRAPFAEGFDETLCYLTPRHTELLDALKAGIRESSGVVVLTGEAGTGKTTLARQLLGRFDGGHRKAFIACEPDGSQGLIHRVCRELQISTSSSQCPAECAAILRRAIEADDPAGRRHVVVFDAAEQLGPEGLKQLDMLSRLRITAGHALRIALVGRPELLRRLQSGEYPEMVKRFAVAQKLDPLSPHETAQYVRHRVIAAGGDPDELIRPEAMDFIVLTSGGVPRNVNETVSAALELAGACESPVVTAQIIRESLTGSYRTRRSTMPSASLTNAAGCLHEMIGRATGVALQAGEKLATIEDRIAELTAAAKQAMELVAAAMEERISRLAAGRDAGEETCQRLTQLKAEIAQTQSKIEQASADGTRQIDLFRARMEKDRSELLQSVRQAIGDEIMVEVRREIDSIRAAAIREARETLNESVRESQVRGREQLAAVESAAARIVRDSVAAVEGAATGMMECLDRAGQVGAKLSDDARSAAATSDRLVSDLRSAGKLSQALAKVNVAARQQEAGVRAVVERAAAGRVKAEQAVGTLNETVRNAEACAQAVGERVAELEARAGKCGTVLEVQIADAQRVEAKLTAAEDSARTCAEQMQSQADATRALASEQAERNDQHRKLMEQVAEQTRLASNVAGQFEEMKNEAVTAYAHLADQSDSARELHERTRELADKIERREKHIETQDKLLTTLAEEREALELRLQQVQSMVESLRLEVSAVLAQPHKLVCEAKAQAVQLHGVCGAVRKIFAGLSRAALDAQQKTEQARQAVEERTHQTIDLANRAVQTVEKQTHQTVDRANRTMQTVEGQTRQTVDRANRAIDQLKRLETIGLALQGWMNETTQTQQHLASLLAAGAPKPEPPAPVVIAAADSQGSETSAVAVAALVARAAGPKTERKTPTTPANAEKTRAERIDRMIRDARAQAEVAPAKT